MANGWIGKGSRVLIVIGVLIFAGWLIGAAFQESGCPLSGTGICVGPCPAFIDRNGDGVCDRAHVSGESGLGAGGIVTETLDVQVSCPLGLVHDPYPGQCNHYVDANGNGICDLSEPGSGSLDVASTGSLTDAIDLLFPQEGTSAGIEGTVACPFGLVNDPYPGQCNHYVDANGNGICDLSEPGSGSLDTASAGSLTGATATPLPQEGPPEGDGEAVACPFGLVNDPYPGQCNRYVDANGNGICDLSEPGLVPTPIPGTEPSPSEALQRQRRYGRGGRGNP